MATRTIKLMGKAYSTEGDVSLVVNFNNSEVYNGTVTTANEAAPTTPTDNVVELASWTIDTSLTGSIPLSIAVSGGTLHFQDLKGNYTGAILQDSDDDGTPDIVDGDYVIVTGVADHFGSMNSNSVSTDGKNNVSITNDEGDGQARSATEDTDGDWIYTVPAGETLTCDFIIDPNLVVLQNPTAV